MRKRLLALVIFSLSISQLSAQHNQGARFSAMANSSAAMFDTWSLNANPAGITNTKTATAALNYSKYVFANELSEQSLAFVLPFGNNFAGLSVNRYGISEFNEIKAGVAFSKKFGDQLSIGLKANIHQIEINQYGNANTFSVDAGVNYALNKQINLGLYVKNPSSQQYNTINLASNIPSVVHFGATYKPSNQVILATTVSKNFDEKFDVSVGVDYKFYDFLSLRGGISAKPFKQYVGVGINYKKLAFDVATENHPQIGYTPQIGLSYAF